MDGAEQPLHPADCAACRTRQDAVAVAGEDPHRTLELLAPVLTGELGCAREPALSLTHDADLRSTLGDLDGAVRSFRASWFLVAHDISLAAGVARDLRVLVRLGNSDRAVDHLLPRLGWPELITDAQDRMWFAATGAWVLRHGRRLDVAPETLAGHPVGQVQAELEALAHDLAERLDPPGAAGTVAQQLARALDDSLVATAPTLPPTRLPAAEPPRSTLFPARPEEVPAFAARAERARRDLDPSLEEAMRGWLAVRDELVPLLRTPEQWSAASTLDRGSCHLLHDPAQERARLEDAADLAAYADDGVGALHAECDLAVLAVREALHSEGPRSPRTRAAREQAVELLQLAEDEDPETAAAASRWYALTTAPDDALGRLRHCGELYQHLGLPRRRAMCLLDAVPFAHPTDPDAAMALLALADQLATGHPVLTMQATELRARLAAAAGDREGAISLHEQALAVVGSIESGKMSILLVLCDLLVEAGDWARLEQRAADAVAVAIEVRDPLALAVAQRHLGLAWLERGRPAEAAELLEAALPVLRRQLPELVGPAAWALGNALLVQGAWIGARAALIVASAAFEADGRLREAGHAQFRAGAAAWDSQDPTAAAAHFDDAVLKARTTASADLLFDALRTRAALRATEGELAQGLAELDGAIAEVEPYTQGSPQEHEFDAEAVEPDVLRQGAHLLAEAGYTDDAVERLARAEALVGGDFELVLRAEGGLVLAEAGRLAEAEERLREVLAALDRAGLDDDRVEVAGALAHALEREGREDDAQAVWAQFGAGD